MSDFDRKIELDDVIALRATDKAILCLIENEQIWIPLSQVDAESEVQDEGDEGTLIISEWFAKKEGLA